MPCRILRELRQSALIGVGAKEAARPECHNGERVMPALKEVGIEPSGKPEMLEIDNIVKR